MVDIPRSSFIPRETASAVPSRVKRRRTFHFFGFLATVIFVCSLALAAGVFFYEKTAEKALATEKFKLIEQKGKFDETRVNEVRAFDRKIRAASLLLDLHITPSKLFSTLEAETMARIQLTNFQLEYEPGYELIVSMQGGTEEFKTVALQALQFGKGTLLDQISFTEIGTSQTIAPSAGATGATSGSNNNKVQFTVETVIPHAVLRYDGSVSQLRPVNTSGVPSAVNVQQGAGSITRQ
jgi:hypothetical protein